jgi:hypothetical protein
MSAAVKIIWLTPQVIRAEAKQKCEEGPSVQTRVVSLLDLAQEASAESSVVKEWIWLDMARMWNTSTEPSKSRKSGTSWGTRGSRLSKISRISAASVDHQDNKIVVFRKLIMETKLRCESADQKLANLLEDFGKCFGEDMKAEDE